MYMLNTYANHANQEDQCDFRPFNLHCVSFKVCALIGNIKNSFVSQQLRLDR